MFDKEFLFSLFFAFLLPPKAIKRDLGISRGVFLWLSSFSSEPCFEISFSAQQDISLDRLPRPYLSGSNDRESLSGARTGDLEFWFLE